MLSKRYESTKVDRRISLHVPENVQKVQNKLKPKGIVL